MKLSFTFATAAIFLSAAAPPAWAQSEPSHERFGPEQPLNVLTNIKIKNFHDDTLGRIRDVGIDLVNGRIVEVLVESDRSLGVNGRIVAVPPLALIADNVNEVYRLNVSREVFKSAAAINLSQWDDAGRSDRVAAAYRLFGQDPYFLEEGATAPLDQERPKLPLGYVERSIKILDLPVGNFQDQQLGKVWSLTLDVPNGRILNVVILAPGNFKTKTIVSATALSFNTQRDALLLDTTKAEFRDEPRYVLTEAAYGQDAHFKQEAYPGPRTLVALEQGRSNRDVDRTVLINRNFRASRVDARNVDVGTMDGRVTLRGWVHEAGDRSRLGDIAVAASRLELVDNQIVVGPPARN